MLHHKAAWNISSRKAPSLHLPSPARYCPFLCSPLQVQLLETVVWTRAPGLFLISLEPITKRLSPQYSTEAVTPCARASEGVVTFLSPGFSEGLTYHSSHVASGVLVSLLPRRLLFLHLSGWMLLLFLPVNTGLSRGSALGPLSTLVP